MPKCILIVIDSLGVGEAPDAEIYGDKGSKHLAMFPKQMED